jgi:hypothetical protein
MLWSRMVRRCGRALILVSALTAIHCRFPIAPCACALPERISGRWVGRSEARDSLDLVLHLDPRTNTFTGTGHVGIAPPFRAVTVERGIVGREEYYTPISRFTLVGWQADAVEFASRKPSTTPQRNNPDRVDGDLRFANGDSTRLTLRRIGP